jgi:uncharacterized heparinase superfamily protein
MNRGRFADSAAWVWLLTRAGGRRAWSRTTNALIGDWRYRLARTDRLLVAPQDLRTADPTLASEIYAGRFTFAGKVVTTAGTSPFQVAPPSADWTRALHGFGWLRHLRAAESAITRANARALVEDWIASRQARQQGMAPEVTARRLIAWLSHAPMILSDAEDAFYSRFLRSILAQTRALRAMQAGLPDSRARLDVAVALAVAALCLDRQPRLMAAATRDLAREIERQILPDGCHISRNPGAVIDLLLDFLPLRQLYLTRTESVPAALMGAIDRLMPMLRFFRHADGALATFNGMGPTRADVVATLASYDETLGEPLFSARHAGYQRLAANGTTVLIDAGGPPPVPHSGQAHAGQLAIEMSTARHRLIVSCGVPGEGRERWLEVARGSAAHSVLVLADTSTCRFAAAGRDRGFGTRPIVGGPRKVEVDRRDTETGTVVRARHYAHAGRFGVLMERRIELFRGGDRLDGEDTLMPAQGSTFSQRADEEYAIRFHLHPAVRATASPQDREIVLVLPNGEAWSFVTDAPGAHLDDSVFLAGPEGPRRTRQIVIAGRVLERAAVRWSFERIGSR